ncbi:MAG TPA: TetR/AcrR family transcriptional regulator [Acidimicrobiales bacterium]|nr:TetR/AcrR family transcriptional regulator [Acidimicrobiales bacterium]
MPRPPDVERRAQLVSALVEAYGEDGLGSRSLRDLAERLGTSHRMLIHHFGSREGMLVAVVQAVEQRQAEVLDRLDGPPADVLERLWATLSDPVLRPFERLFFECYARGASGERPFDRLLPGIVDSWLDAGTALAPGLDPALARLSLAVVRGLLLDLVATGDEQATTQALVRFADLLRG